MLEHVEKSRTAKPTQGDCVKIGSLLILSFGGSGGQGMV